MCIRDSVSFDRQILDLSSRLVVVEHSGMCLLYADQSEQQGKRRQTR